MSGSERAARRGLGWLGVALGAWIGAAGCATVPGLDAAGARPLLPRAPAEQGRCRVAASQTSPLVTEWPASEKANLEALLRAGGVAVAYGGCSLRLLPQCRVRGSYRWQRTTPAADLLEISNEDELYAKLPLGAASLEGELKRAGKLAVTTVVAGQLRLDDPAVSEIAADGPCAQATHVVTALSVGAFTMSAGGSVNGRAGASVAQLADARAGANRSAGLVRSAGSPEICGEGTDAAPHPNCGSPIQVFLAPLPGRAAEEGPPGTVKVDFVSGNPASRWDVYADDQVICTTPCARWIRPERPVLLRAREEGLFSPSDKVHVQTLLPHAGAGALQLAAHPTARGRLATGIVFTSFGGMGVITGTALAGIGCSRDRPTMCKAGLITLGVGSAVLAGSIWLILDALPRAQILRGGETGTVLARPRVRVGPGGIFGTF